MVDLKTARRLEFAASLQLLTDDEFDSVYDCAQCMRSANRRIWVVISPEPIVLGEDLTTKE